KNRSTDDAISSVVHTALTHLEQKDSYVRMLFVDFTSAFNTMIPQTLTDKLSSLGLRSSLWVLDFLTNSRSPYPRRDNPVSSMIFMPFRPNNLRHEDPGTPPSIPSQTPGPTRNGPPAVCLQGESGSRERHAVPSPWAHSHLFFDFSSAFNTIQPLRLKDKLARMQADPHLVSWITDYLTGRPQYVRLKDCTSETVVSSTGASQKFSDDTAIVACVRGGQEAEYRNLVEVFVAWCHRNKLLLNTSKTKEMVVDFRRARPLTQPVFIEGVEIEMVRTYRYLGLHLDERLDWSANTDILYRKGQSRLYFLRRLGSFNICRKLLQMFYQTVVSSCLFYAVVCWGGSIKKRDEMRLDKLVRRAGSVVGVELDSVVKVAERRTLHKLLSIMDDDGHPLHTIIMDRRSKFSGRLLSQSCSTDRPRRSFEPAVKIQRFADGTTMEGLIAKNGDSIQAPNEEQTGILLAEGRGSRGNL
ncbi:hypothetical protein NFI96_001779, partial [Prochilodus magdalenae]